MAQTRCPRCGKPAIRIQSRLVLRHVPEVDDDPRVERTVCVAIIECPAPAGCGGAWEISEVRIQLQPLPTTARYVPEDPRQKRTLCAR